MLLALEVFQCAMLIDLNMVCYHIQLTEYASNLCTIIIPWGKEFYYCLPKVVSNSPDIFQNKMNNLFQGFEYIHAYTYDILILTGPVWKAFLQKFKLTLNILKESRVKYNI